MVGSTTTGQTGYQLGLVPHLSASKDDAVGPGRRLIAAVGCAVEDGQGYVSPIVISFPRNGV